MLVALVASRCGMRGGAVPWGALRAQEELGRTRIGAPRARPLPGRVCRAGTGAPGESVGAELPLPSQLHQLGAEAHQALVGIWGRAPSLAES